VTISPRPKIFDNPKLASFRKKTSPSLINPDWVRFAKPPNPENGFVSRANALHYTYGEDRTGCLRRYLQNSKGSGHQLHIKRKELPWFGLERPKDVEQTI
jgi:hypothetical protein